LTSGHFCFISWGLALSASERRSRLPQRCEETIKAFVDGVTAATVGAIARAAFVLGRRAIHDIPTAAITLVGFAVLWRFKRVPEPVLIAISGVIGIFIAGVQG
jgi:chromate transport protein ChrA